MPKTHSLKTWPSYFEAIARGEKPFEVRRHDRDFAVGDTLRLLEWDPGKDVSTDAFRYTGRELRCEVTYFMPGGRFGIDPAFCVLGIRTLPGCIPPELMCVAAGEQAALDAVNLQGRAESLHADLAAVTRQRDELLNALRDMLNAHQEVWPTERWVCMEMAAERSQKVLAALAQAEQVRKPEGEART